MAQVLRRHAVRVAVTGLIAPLGLAALTAAAWWGARTVSAHPRISTSLTWQRDIAPIFARQCQSCHGAQSGADRVPGAAPAQTPLMTYGDARPWVRAIREEVLERRMPPARGVPGVDTGVDDYPLSPMERDLIVAWIDGGAPQTLAGASRDGDGDGDGDGAAAVFWCPMHPEVRADRAGACPLCGMTLAPFAPDLARRYGWTVTVRPAALAPRTPPARRAAATAIATATATATAAATAAGNAGRVTLTIEERAHGARAGTGTRPRLATVHEHPLHLFIVSEDFRSFEHVHPSLTPDATGGDAWSIGWRPPAEGRYWFYGDFLPIGGSPQMLQRAIAVGAPSGPARAPGMSRVPAAPSPLAASTVRTERDDVLVASSAGLRGTLTAPSLRAGDSHRLTIVLDDAATAAPVTDLQPYLGAWGHLFVLHEQHTEALHAHPEGMDTTPGGPAIAFDVLFPRAGLYHLWCQVQRRGAIVTLHFIVRVHPRT